MKRGLFSFSKPSPNGVTASGRIAAFCSEQLEIPLMWDKSINQKWDILYIVAGAYAFCDALEDIGAAVEKAGRIIWIQNDYTIIPPKAVSNAESPFRLAFRKRRAAGLPDIEYWTTILSLSKEPNSRYINWNKLTWEPLTDKEYTATMPHHAGTVLYYGAFRQDRLEAFDRFFNMKNVPWIISNGSNKFEERYPRLVGQIDKAIPRSEFIPYLATHALGLYIEDSKSHVEYHSPANRFYEMLSARLPMVFQKECLPMLKRAGVEVDDWVVETEADVLKALKNASKIGAKQRSMYDGHYRRDLIGDVRTARKAVEK